MFKIGNFTLHSGQKSDFLIDCESLTDDDLKALACIGARMVGPFHQVYGIPRGGKRFAQALEEYKSDNPKDGLLLVDDVLTSGQSMQLHAGAPVMNRPVKGLVIYARNKDRVPSWVIPIFTMGPALPKSKGNEHCN